MSWVAVAVAGASLVTGAMQADAAGDAADAASGAADRSSAAFQRRYNETAENLNPYMQAGQGALDRLTAAQNGNYSFFMNSPDYLYAQQAGTQALDAGATAGGNLWGGGADADRIRLGQGLATQNFNTWRGFEQGLAGLGQNAAVSLGQFGAQSVGNQANSWMQGANAQGQGAINTANAYGNAINGVVGAFGQYAGNKSSYQPPTNQVWPGNYPAAGGGGYGAFEPNQPAPAGGWRGY